MKRFLYRSAFAALVAGSAFGQVVTPSAQQAPAPATPEVDDDVVIVTARRREEQVQDVPAAVTGLSAVQLEEAGGLRDVKDLSYLLPGLSFVDTGNINAENNIRGAGAGTARTAGVDSPIAVLRDGASVTGGTIGGRTFARQDLFDLARVEVTRGPQGALYGVNAVGGVMQAISQRPKDTWGASVRTQYSPDIERIAVDVIANAPITENLGARFGVQVADKGKGFFYNDFLKSYSDVEEYTGYKASLEWTPLDTLNIFLVADGSDDKGASNLIRSVNGRNDPTEPLSQIGPPDIDGPYRHSMNTSNITERRIDNYNMTIAWQTPIGELTSTSLYRERDTIFRQDQDQSAPGYASPPFPAATCATRSCTVNFLDHTEITSQDLRLAGDFGQNFTWQVGGNIQGRQSEFATVSDGRTVSAVNLNPSPTANLSSTVKEEELQTGAFATVSWLATEALTLDAAVRYNNSEKKTDAYTIVRGPVAGVSCVGIYTNPFNAPNLDPRCLRTRNVLEETFSTTAPSVSAKYAIADNFRLFASAGVGYRAGGFNANSVLDPQITPTYDPEKNTAVEVGAKWEWGSSFFTLTGFRNNFDDLLVTIETIGPDSVSRNSRFNAGKAFTWGADLEGFGRIRLQPGWGALNYTAAVNYLQGEIEEGPYAGRRVEGSPEWTYSGTVTHRKLLFDDVRLVSSLTYRGQRGGYTNTTKINNMVEAPDLNLFNGSIGIENRQWRLILEARNLFDEEYVSLRDPGRSVYGDPREVRLTLAFAIGSEERGFRSGD